MLDEIMRHKREEIAGRQQSTTLETLRSAAREAEAPRTPTFRFPWAVIAEVKRRSPSAGPLAPDVDPVAQAQIYEKSGASAISVLTDERYFGGSPADLRAVHDAVSVPVLCKDFILSDYQLYEARANGADLVLLIVAALADHLFRTLLETVGELGMAALVEVHDQHDLARALAADAELIGINNRDLTDFSVNLLTTEYLAPLIPDRVTVVSESGIESRADVDRVTRAGATVGLIGSALMRSSDPGEVLRGLLA